MLNKKQIETLDSAIAHLNGYAAIIESRTGFKPVAVDNCIKELRKIKSSGYLA